MKLHSGLVRPNLSSCDFVVKFGLAINTEEVEHIFCACDYALPLNGNNCVFYIPNLASLVPKSLWPGTEGNRNCQREVKLQLGSLKGRSTLKMLQVGKASSWSTGSVASPPFRVADPSRGRTA